MGLFDSFRKRQEQKRLKDWLQMMKPTSSVR